MSKKLPTSVFLDLDNTLYEYSPCHQAGLGAALEMMAQKLRISVKEAENIYENGRSSIKSRLGQTASSHSRLLYFRQGLILEGMGSQATLCYDFENTYWNFFLFEMKLKEGARNFIGTLKFENIPIFLLTDLTDNIQLRKIIKLELENTFSEIISSELAGGDKITKKPFEYLFSLLPPELLERPVFIGDSIQDSPHLKNLEVATPETFIFTRNFKADSGTKKVKNFHEIESLIF
jgi:FMN phosphatase YigB (HAD superfamily)